MNNDHSSHDYDYIIIGSGFGGSVSALRLSEKGYKVLVIEKGKWFKSEDFPETNWNLKKWLWLPLLKFHGFFKITLFKNITTLSGVGVGGGSLVYANTLPIPNSKFFNSGSWSRLVDWETELKPFYAEALRMLGASTVPRSEIGDLLLKELASDIGKEESFKNTNNSVYFGEPGVTVKDPYFGGGGPDRTGCIFCGACMTGCRHNAKNTLDKNYLYFAQRNGAKILAESEVTNVEPLDDSSESGGYRVRWKSSTLFFGKGATGSAAKSALTATAKGIVFAGGVLGTVKLLLKLKRSSLPLLSDMVGRQIRTNSESLIAVTTFDKDKVLSDGIAIGSILDTGNDTHLEIVRYGAGSGFWRLLMFPIAHGRNAFTRVTKAIWDIVTKPIQNLRVMFVSDWAKRTQILLFMQTLNSTLRFSRGFFGVSSSIDEGKPPTAFIPIAKYLSEKYAEKLNGKPMVLLTETILGIPTTAHILGGAVMAENESNGVIDSDNHVFGYDNMLVCDGSMISANLGVNPALTITALTERAMSKIPTK